jgi:radical SAM protein with 4Fe4S-binding SPASM domain
MITFIRYLLCSQKKPLYLSVFITNACNLKCKHCFYPSHSDNTDEMPIENIVRLSRSIKDILNISITGGEPFLNNNIVEIVRAFHENSKPKVISIVTNGFYVDKIKSNVLQMLDDNPGIKLSIIVSIDGFENLHDNIRSKKGSFKNAVSTIIALKKIKQMHNNLSIGSIATLSSMNKDVISQLYKYLNEELGIDSVQINFLRGTPSQLTVNNSYLSDFKLISDMARKDVYSGKLKGYTNFSGSGIYQAAGIIFREVIYKTVTENKYILPCAAGRLNGIIYPNGEVYACEMLNSSKMGSLMDFNYDIMQLWRSEKAEEVRQSVRKTNCFCTHECQLTTSVLFNWGYLTRIIREYIKIKFRRLLA